MYNRRVEAFNLRKSQLLSPFGIGSLIDINNQSILIADSELWGESDEIITDTRLEDVLRTNGLVAPPVPNQNGQDLDRKSVVGYHFPTWYFSPETKELKKLKEWQALLEEKDLKKFYESPFRRSNNNAYEDLVPVRILLACKNGHLQDFPWMEWCHNEKIDNNIVHNLKLTSKGGSSAISELRVECSCGVSPTNLGSIFNPKIFNGKLNKIGISCNGEYLWNSKKEECKEELKAMMRSQNNLYFPQIKSSVNIPLVDNQQIDNLKHHSLYQHIVDDINSYSNLDEYFSSNEFNYVKQKISSSLDINEEKLKKLLIEINNSETKETAQNTVMDYRSIEFNILNGTRDYNKKSENNFSISIYSKDKIIKNKYKNLFECITLVKNVEIVSALTGYSRIHPVESDFMEDEESIESGTLVSLRRSDGRYLANKAKGEGIFLQLSSSHLKDWEKSCLQEDADIFNKVYKLTTNVKMESHYKYIDPKFYLIHTLSHLLIKELTNSSGYSSSSIRERLYFDNDKQMYGILLYTYSNDENGTLGGLVKQGVPEIFFNTLSNAVESAKWCSFDPICIDSTGQGRDSLNLAACHACTLISETSCEYINTYLDRSMLVGTLERPDLGFLTRNY